jgi:TrwC relaxase
MADTPHAPPEATRVGLTAPRHVPLRVGVTMSMHKLTAGSGYDYLTRQVAALDSTERGHTALASYCNERGETPGVWIGSGLDGIDGLTAGDSVTAEQMRALFGCGLHPLTLD